MANANDSVCTKCREHPRAGKHRWCRVCFNAWRSEHRQSRKVANACERVNAEGKRPDQGEPALPQPATPGSADSPQVGAPATSANGSNGNGHFAPSPHARAGARVLLTALGRKNGAGAKALIDGLERIALGTEPNPWPILALWKHLRDTVDGLPKPAPEVKDPRRLARIILTNGPAPSPSAAAEPADPPRGRVSPRSGCRRV